MNALRIGLDSIGIFTDALRWFKPLEHFARWLLSIGLDWIGWRLELVKKKKCKVVGFLDIDERFLWILWSIERRRLQTTASVFSFLANYLISARSIRASAASAASICLRMNCDPIPRVLVSESLRIFSNWFGFASLSQRRFEYQKKKKNSIKSITRRNRLQLVDAILNFQPRISRSWRIPQPSKLDWVFLFTKVASVDQFAAALGESWRTFENPVECGRMRKNPAEDVGWHWPFFPVIIQRRW